GHEGMMQKQPLTVEHLVRVKKERLLLELLTDERGLSRAIHGPDISSPGLVLTGFTDRFPSERIQVLGETEIAFLHHLSPEERRQALEIFFSFNIPAVFVTKGQEPPAPLLDIAIERGTPVIQSQLRTADFYYRIKPFLDEYF